MKIKINRNILESFVVFRSFSFYDNRMVHMLVTALLQLLIYFKYLFFVLHSITCICNLNTILTADKIIANLNKDHFI